MSSPVAQNLDEESSLLGTSDAAPVQPSADRSVSTSAKVALATVVSLALLSAAVFYRPAASSVTDNLAETSTTDFGVNAISRIYDGRTNSNSNGNLGYLDRHSIDCPYDFDPINGFTLGSTSSIRCASLGGKNGGDDWRNTGSQRISDDLYYLKDQSLFCPNDKLLSYFKARTFDDWGRKMTFDFRCNNYNVKRVHSCQDRYTDFNDKGNSIAFLDRHRADCRSDEAMQGWQGQIHCTRRNFWGCQEEKFRIMYKCCNIETYDPTAAPIFWPTPSPTKSPSPRPTLAPTDVPTPIPTSLPAFHNPVAKRTAFSDGGNRIIFLDRHNVDCTGNPITKGHVQRGHNDDIAFEYSCAQLNPFIVSTKSDYFEPSFQDSGGERQFEFLDRQKTYCELGSFMTRFQGQQKDWNKFRFSYVCNKYNALVTPNMCNEKQTAFSDYGDKLYYLDRHTFQCDFGKALRGFKFERSGKQIRYNYECCSAEILYPSAAPTEAPISNPTQKPSAVPTEAPSPVPTLSPSPVPTEYPTQKPNAVPTEAPSEKPSEAPISEPTISPTEAPTDEPTDSPVADPEESGDNGFNIGDYTPSIPNDDGLPPLSCAFTYIKGTTGDVPAGCVLIADKDINFLKDGQTSKAAYLCNAKGFVKSDLENLFFFEQGVSSITTVLPGKATKATIATGDNFDGYKYTFTSKFNFELTSFHFHGTDLGNDAIHSIDVEITDLNEQVQADPEECSAHSRMTRSQMRAKK